MRNPYACIYTSSYDRGLEHLLKIWPEVKKAMPEAELHICYGWQLFTRFYANNPASMAWKAKMEEMMKAPGIIHHGHLPQPEIKKLMEQCGLWTYPTHFGEINCISAQKAQAYGCVPIVINYAALQTTVKYGLKVDGDIYEKEVRERYKERLIWALQNPSWQEECRQEMMPWAQKKFPWSETAKQWDREFKSDELKEALDIVLKQDPVAAKYIPVQLQQKWRLKETV
jgi:glycosyltransferase involved in cell wall biosynthesis